VLTPSSLNSAASHRPSPRRREIPFYNAVKVTAHIAPLLGPYYRRDETPVLTAMWRNWVACRFIEDEGDVVCYKGLDEWRQGGKGQ